MHMSRLSLPQKRDKIVPPGAERHMQQTRNNFKAGGELQVRKVLGDGLGDLDHRELFDAQVFGHEEDFLAVLVGPEDLGAFADDEDTKVGIEEPEEVVSIRHNVSGWVLI